MFTAQSLNDSDDQRGWGGALVQSSTPSSQTSTEEIASDRPSFCLAMVYFSFCFYFTGCKTSEFYFCLVDHVLYVCSHGECEEYLERSALFCERMVSCMVLECVHTCIYLISVFVLLRCKGFFFLLCRLIAVHTGLDVSSPVIMWICCSPYTFKADKCCLLLAELFVMNTPSHL